jgi:hypothetical protein
LSNKKVLTASYFRRIVELGSKRFEEQQASGNVANRERRSVRTAATGPNGERTEIGRSRKAGQPDGRCQNALSQRGENPKGEWKRRAERFSEGENRQREMSCEAAGVKRPAVELNSERAWEQPSEEAKQQAGNDDPGMELVKARAVAGERNAVASDRSRFREKQRLRRAGERRSESWRKHFSGSEPVKRQAL